MEVIGVDVYNQSVTGDVSITLRTGASNEQQPCVLIINSSGGNIAGTLDSYYYLGQGARGGVEREFVVVDGSKDIRCQR